MHGLAGDFAAHKKSEEGLIASDIIDHGIIMTGGSSLLRNLPELVYRKTGVKAFLAEDALYCVAKGTGIALEHLDVYKKAIISKR